MLTHFLDLLAAVISVTSLLIVTYGALIGIISFLKNEIRRFTGGYSITNIRKLRATFGTYLLLGLEFLIASDILMLYQLSYCRISKTGTKVIYIFQLTKYKQTIFTIIIKISALLFISTALCISCVWINRSLSPIKGL